MTKPTTTEELDFMRFRIEYSQKSLSESDVDADPFRQFRTWFDEAVAAKAHEPAEEWRASPAGLQLRLHI